MKIMTLNSHSLEEERYEEKRRAFVEGVFRERPQVIALQEVNQTRTAKPVAEELLKRSGYFPCELGSDCEPAVIREDNHGYRAAKELAERGVFYAWTWVAAKIGYEKYDEGLALFSAFPVLGSRQFFITGLRDYRNWKTRKILGIRVETDRGPEEFYSVHMGWWKDEEEPFKEQWERISRRICAEAGTAVWLMGDFNSPAHVRGEGYELVCSSGWLDCYELAGEKDEGVTVDHSIDGWKDGSGISGMRIDQIWTNRRVPVKCSRVIFNGETDPVVSDHFGVLAECGDFCGEEASGSAGHKTWQGNEGER